MEIDIDSSAIVSAISSDKNIIVEEECLKSIQEPKVCIPAGVVVLRPADEGAVESHTKFLAGTGIPPSVTLWCRGLPNAAYRVNSEKEQRELRAILPVGIEMIHGGEWIPLDDGCKNDEIRESLANVASLNAIVAAARTLPVREAPSLLSKYSLRGRAGEMEERAQSAQPLLGNVCLSGQTTIWYAPPNAGKTLCALRLTHDAITERRIASDDVYYFNADDSSQGLAQKLQIMDDLGAHTIVPGFAGFKNADLLSHLKQAAERDEARGTLVIIDTVKKFTSLMDKRQSSEFADACRQYSMRGGTILGLAHTAKNANPDGKLRYAGTTDLLEDFDAAYLLSPIEGVGDVDKKVVEFSALKRRGDNAEAAAYSYAAEAGITYEERLLSVTQIDADTADEFKRVAAEQNDAVVINAIIALIGEGICQKMLLAKAAAKRSGVSERAAIRILETCTGDEPPNARWRFVVKARGAKVYELITPPSEGTA